MRCPNCENEAYIEDGYDILNVESSESSFDDWDQIMDLKCRSCGTEFRHID